MKLSTKLGLMFGAFGAFALLSVVLSFVCILMYMDSAFTEYRHAVSGGGQVETLRARIQHMLESLAEVSTGTSPSYLDADLFQRKRWVDARIQEMYDHTADPAVRRDLNELREQIGHLCTLGQELIAQRDQGHLQPVLLRKVAQEVSRAREPANSTIVRLRRYYGLAPSQTAGRATDVLGRVALILAANASLAIVLGIVGLAGVRRWLIDPIARLGEAADEIADGNLNYRIHTEGRDELAALSRRVNHMAESLDSAQRQLVERERMAAVGEMVSAIAHNIRNPLAGVRASTQNTLRDVAGNKDAEKHLLQVLETLDSFERWLRGFLHTNRPVVLTRQETDLRTLLDRVVSTLRPSAERVAVQIDWSVQGDVSHAYMDDRQVEQALSALVSNAIEASPRGGHVEIRARGGDGNAVELSIFDQGKGIPQEMRAKVLLPYYSTKPGGTGIGLASAKKIVESHGGKIELLDAPETGTEVRIELPG